MIVKLINSETYYLEGKLSENQIEMTMYNI